MPILLKPKVSKYNMGGNYIVPQENYDNIEYLNQFDNLQKNNYSNYMNNLGNSGDLYSQALAETSQYNYFEDPIERKYKLDPVAVAQNLYSNITGSAGFQGAAGQLKTAIGNKYNPGEVTDDGAGTAAGFATMSGPNINNPKQSNNVITGGAVVNDPASAGGGTTGPKIGKALGNVAGQAAMSAIGPGIDMLADLKMANKKESAAGGLRGAKQGYNIGSTIGSFIPIPGGKWIGGGVGALIGGGIGWTRGKAKEMERKKFEAEEKKKKDEHNAMMANMARKKLGQAQDLQSLQKYEELLAQEEARNPGLNQVMYQKGGLLKYGVLKIEETKNYLNDLKVEIHQKGGKLKKKPILTIEQEIQVSKKSTEEKPKTTKRKETTKVFKIKKGKKLSSCKKGSCSCKKCATKIFRRGGKMDTEKQNVIVNGPSHEEYNKTGVKDDKGLAVVKNNKKVAEIESDELIINAVSSKKIEELKKKAEAGDQEAYIQLAELLEKELKDNTYDYSNLMN